MSKTVIDLDDTPENADWLRIVGQRNNPVQSPLETAYQKVFRQKFNPNHDERGRFTTSGGDSGLAPTSSQAGEHLGQMGQGTQANAQAVHDSRLGATPETRFTPDLGRLTRDTATHLAMIHDNPNYNALSEAGKQRVAHILAVMDQVNQTFAGAGEVDPKKPASDMATTDRMFRTSADPNAPLTADRQAQDAAAVKSFVDAAASVPNQRIAIITGGITGAGKTTMLTKEADSLGIQQDASGNITNFATVNADDFKTYMADHGMTPYVADLKPLEMSALLHEESSNLAQALFDHHVAEGKNVILDTTMGGSESLSGKLAQLHDAGYTVTGSFVSVSPEWSMESSMRRFERAMSTPNGGRFVPPSVIEAQGTGAINATKNEDVYYQFHPQTGTQAQRFDKTFYITNDRHRMGTPVFYPRAGA